MSRLFLLDTNAVSDFINHRHGVHERAMASVRRGERIGTCPPVVGELMAGIRGSHSVEPNLQRARRGLTKLRHWPFDIYAAHEFGRLWAELRRIGRPMQVVDMQLAAIARLLGATVVSTDSDLAAVPGLTVENWAEVPSPPAAPTS